MHKSYLYPTAASSTANVLNSSYIFLKIKEQKKKIWKKKQYIVIHPVSRYSVHFTKERHSLKKRHSSKFWIISWQDFLNIISKYLPIKMGSQEEWPESIHCVHLLWLTNSDLLPLCKKDERTVSFTTKQLKQITWFCMGITTTTRSAVVNVILSTARIMYCM